MNIFIADISIGERLLGGLCWFALILFVGLIIVEIIKNRKEKPFPLRHKKIFTFIWIIFIILLISLPDYHHLVFFIGSLIFVIYAFREYYIQEREKKEQSKKRKGL